MKLAAAVRLPPLCATRHDTLETTEKRGAFAGRSELVLFFWLYFI